MFKRSKKWIKEETTIWFLHVWLSFKSDPWRFTIWFIVSVIIALSPVWLPVLISFAIGKDYQKMFATILGRSPLIIFSIIFLTEGLSISITRLKSSSNLTAAGVRGVTAAVVILVIIVLASLMPFTLVYEQKISFSFQLVLFIISLVLGIYMYGFREIEWEEKVHKIYVEQQKEDVEDLIEKTDIADSDGKIKL